MNIKQNVLRGIQQLLLKLQISTLVTKYHPLNFFTFYSENRTFAIKFHTFSEIIENREKLLNSQRSFFNFTDFICHALKVAQGSSYIIFHSENRNHFVQFGLLDNYLFLDIPVTPLNDNINYYKKIRKLLDSYGFNFTDNELMPMTYTYIIEEKEDLHTLNAHFALDYDLAARFTNELFCNLYKDDTNKIHVELGYYDETKENLSS